MKYELVVIWETGEKEIHEYRTEEEAREASNGYEMAFGHQVSWVGIRKVVK